MRSNGTAKELDARRRLAVQRVEDGWTQREVAAFLGVHPVTVARWVARVRADGDAGLAAKPAPGRPPFLTAGREKPVRGWLADPPTGHGLRTDLWTARRGADLVEERPGVTFRPHHLRAWPRKRNSPPDAGPAGPPAGPRGPRRVAQGGLAADRNKVRRQNAHLVLIDASGLLLNPLARRSWAVRGKTPVIGGGGGHRKRVSVIGAVSACPAARRSGRYFAALPDGYFAAEAVVEFLRDVLRHLRGKGVVVWDGGGNREGPAIRALLRRNKRRTPERLPASAPEWNPVEAVWSWLKYGQLANFAPDGVPELDDEVIDRLLDLGADPGLLRVLWERPDRPFPHKPSG